MPGGLPAGGVPLSAAPPGSVDLGQVVPSAGERGQEYLRALRAAGLPEVGLDAQEILFARGTCDALASGTSRQDALAQFATVGQAYATVSGLSPAQVATVFVDTATAHFC